MTYQSDIAKNSPGKLDAAAYKDRLAIYQFNPLAAGPLAGWVNWMEHAAGLGFTHVLSAPFFAGASLRLPDDFGRVQDSLAWQGSAIEAITQFAQAARANGLRPLLDLYPGRIGADNPALAKSDGAFNRMGEKPGVDPRAYPRFSGSAEANWSNGAASVAAFWSDLTLAWQDAGISGFRLSLSDIPAEHRRTFLGALRPAIAGELLGWTPSVPWPELEELRGQGLDYVFASLPWWDFRADWFWEEAKLLASIAPAILPLEDPYGPRLAAAIGDAAGVKAAQDRVLNFTGTIAQGLMMPMGFESGDIASWDDRASRLLERTQRADIAAVLHRMKASQASQVLAHVGSAYGKAIAFVTSDFDRSFADSPELTLFNPSLRHRVPVTADSFMTALKGRFLPDADMTDTILLDPGNVAVIALHGHVTKQMRIPSSLAEAAKTAASASGRIGIEAVSPALDSGRFPVKRLAGEIVTVSADLLCDGHDQLAAVVHYRKAGDAAWGQARMKLVNNDRWQARFFLPEVGVYQFFVEAWRDAFATYRDELRKKHDAGVDVRVELMEGRNLIADAGAPLAPIMTRLEGLPQEEKVTLLLGEEVATLMRKADPRPFAARSPIHGVDADRLESRFASWYEIFPRSMSDDPNRHGTFRDVERHLPRIRDMGFNVLYFPPIHPIGKTNRKGRNNTLTPAADDPGSPYAIGSAEGGHDALHPELGSFEDFQHMREAAEAHGLEIALDFAIQCSPDHPWLTQHPGWFDWRPDGSIKYAENPPKKYQDIVNVDFYAKDAVPGLWVALAEAVLFWCEHGVRIFRVDNPHTKPFPFWEWMIAQVRQRFPDALFLAEAFTRPKIMNRLGKIGFSQSYTYFTWRNTRAELEEYLTTLTQGPEVDFFRPNFFVNTPDINPIFLQTSGRAGHLIRAALAATLSGLWGVYSGFELCEATPLPGREEYLDSEKYQIRAWDWNRSGNIVPEITMLNRLRAQNPALQSHLGISFLPSDNGRVMVFEKASPDRSNVVIVAVSLDPARPQATNTEIPFYKWNVPDNGQLAVTDLVPGRGALWQGKWQHVTLDPSFPFALWRVEPEIV